MRGQLRRSWTTAFRSTKENLAIALGYYASVSPFVDSDNPLSQMRGVGFFRPASFRIDFFALQESVLQAAVPQAMIFYVSVCLLLSLLCNQATAVGTRACNASELFDVLVHDFWLLQFGHSYLGGQLPDTEPSYALAMASCQVYSTQFDRHRFLIQACFQAGEYKSTVLQHRMAGLCNPHVLNSLRPNLACLRSIYASRSYDICMASALQQFSTIFSAHNPAPMRYSDAPYHCANVRQSVLCSRYPMNVHCAGEQLNDVRAMFDTVWKNNAVVEGHYECPLRPLAPFERTMAVKEDPCKRTGLIVDRQMCMQNERRDRPDAVEAVVIAAVIAHRSVDRYDKRLRIPVTADRRRLHAFCRVSAKAASDPLTVTVPKRIVRELLIEDKAPILSNISSHLAVYVQCARVALFGTKLGGRRASFSPMHDWMGVVETFVKIAQGLRRVMTSNSTCGPLLLSHAETTPCFQCTDKLMPSYALNDYRHDRFSLPTYVEAIVQSNDPLGFCRATVSLIKFMSCLVESVRHTCQMQLFGVATQIEALRNKTETIYGCPVSDPWYVDLERAPAYDDQKKVQRTGALALSTASMFCDA